MRRTGFSEAKCERSRNTLEIRCAHKERANQYDQRPARDFMIHSR